MMTPSSEHTAQRILVIDDETLIHADFRKILIAPPDTGIANEAELFGEAPARATGPTFELACAAQGADGLQLAEAACREGRPFSVAFVDMRMPPGWDGVETILRLWQADPHLQVVICTAYSDYSWEDTVAKLGAGDNWVVLKKPFDNIEALQLAHSLSTKWKIAQRDRLQLASLDEIVHRRTAELRRSEQRFLQAFRGNPVPVTLQSLADGRYLDANPAFLNLIGIAPEAILSRRPSEVSLWVGPDLWAESLASVRDNRPLRAVRGTVRAADGATREVLLSVDRIEIDDGPALLSTLQDITERLELERQLRHSQKMEAVGQLAAGIAHDFNNVLTVIQGFTGMALTELTLPPEHQQGLKQVQFAAERAARLTRQLLLFSRKQVAQTRQLNLGACVDGFREMLRCVLPATVELIIRHAPGLPLIVADEANLGQVLMNLVVNARDALADGGHIWIETHVVELDETTGRRTGDARPGRFVCLTVRDDGAGIDAAVLPRIFEPFFTTKKVGEGTGLGLSTVYGIVRQHEGWIEVSSAPGQGACFQLFLPAAAPGAAPAGIAPAASTSPGGGRGERILLVEDEAPVRKATRLILTRSGYAVTEAPDAVAALALVQREPFDFDLLLTDMVMPNGMSGTELAAQLRRDHPQLAVILTTGYSEQLITEKAGAIPGARILLKPYASEALLGIIRNLLGAPAQPS